MPQVDPHQVIVNAQVDTCTAFAAALYGVLTDAGIPCGIMIIHMYGDDEATMEEAIWLSQASPGLKVGVNLLGVRADLALQDSLRAGLAATWSDSPGVNSKETAERAFTIQALPKANTSGPATGKAPDLTKLRAMREALGTRPLAVASGITPDNIHEFGGPLTHVLVSTGVSRSFHELDGNLLDRLAKAAANRCLGDTAIGRSRQDTVA